MKLFIPEIGTVLTLAEPWTFTVLNEKRNTTLAEYLGYKVDKDRYPRYPLGSRYNDSIFGFTYELDPVTGKRDREVRHEHKYYRPTIKSIKHTWPAGTELIVDRLYIRQGNKEFSSVTFKTRVNGKVVRFFARLSDVNKIEIE